MKLIDWFLRYLKNKALEREMMEAKAELDRLWDEVYVCNRAGWNINDTPLHRMIREATEKRDRISAEIEALK